MKPLLIEHTLFEGKISEDQNGKFLVKGVLQRADAPNQNNRIYLNERGKEVRCID